MTTPTETNGSIVTPSHIQSLKLLWHNSLRLAIWWSPYTKRETGVNEPITAVSLCLVSQEECMPWCHGNNWAKAGWYPVRFSLLPQHYRTNFHSSANFSEILENPREFLDVGLRQWCVLSPLFCLYQVSLHNGSRAKSDLWSHFTRQQYILPIMKK